MKESILAVFVVAVLWIGFLFANAAGPDPGVNGVFGTATTCARSGCHSDLPLNAPNGSLTISGLPVAWIPGQVYPLTVTVARPSAMKYGFQLSAVVDSTNSQAGMLQAASNRVQIVSGRGIQFAEHSSAATMTPPFNGTFSLVWQAPTDPSVGNIRLDVAALAANGDNTANGDYVYTQTIIVPVADGFSGSPTRTYALTDLSSTSSKSFSSNPLPDVGYARIIADADSTTPSGIAIFALRTNNVVVTEAGVPASALLQIGRIYAEVNGPVNTGIAIANPGPQPANITFSFTNNVDGTESAPAALTIPAGGQLARFLDQDPFKGHKPLQGALTFSSNVPVSVIALRGLTNERNEFLISTLPVINTVTAPVTSQIVLPHFADGTGWTTSVLLVNPTDAAITGTVQFLNQNGTATQMTANGTTATSFPYSIPRRSSIKLSTAGSSAGIQSGSVWVTPDAGENAPAALSLFSYKQAQFTVSEAGVLPFAGTGFRMYTEVSGFPGDIGSVQAGIAIANTSSAAATVNFELFQQDGSSSGLVSSLVIPAKGQIVKFLSDIFPSLLPPFRGVLRMTTMSSQLAVVGLRTRYNERSDFLITTTPPAIEATPSTSAEFDFPHIVNGGGYTTQFILFGGTPGQSPSGTLKFFRQDGTPMLVGLNP